MAISCRAQSIEETSHGASHASRGGLAALRLGATNDKLHPAVAICHDGRTLRWNCHYGAIVQALTLKCLP